MRISASPHTYIGVGLCERRREPLPVYVRDGTGTGGKTGASNASNAAPVSHTRTCTLYTSNQTFIRLSGVSYPDRSMPFLRSFSVEFLCTHVCGKKVLHYLRYLHYLGLP